MRRCQSGALLAGIRPITALLAGAVALAAGGCVSRSSSSLATAGGESRAAMGEALPADGRDVLRLMHGRYAGHWFKTLTFVQRTTRTRPDGSEVEETWYEAARAPDRLRIDIGDPAQGNGVLSTPDSMYVMRGGTLARAQAGGNELIPFVIGVYTQPVDSTVRQLAHVGFDYSRVRRDTWQDRAVLVVGARDRTDSTSSQFWIDEERLVLARIVLAPPPGAPADAVQDIRFDGYVPLDRSWLATKVLILVGGRQIMREEYTQYTADPALPDALFDVTRWRDGLHWAQGTAPAKP